MAGPTSTIPLLDGTAHPVVGFGTYKVGIIPSLASGQNGVASTTGNDIGQVVTAALQAGYTMLDCAAFYENEKEIGDAIAAYKAANPAAATPYLCSKIWTATIHSGREAILAEADRMLADLRTPCLDLLLIHWPVPSKHIEAYRVLQELKAAGKVRSIGVSNYTVEDYRDLVSAEGITEKPVVNQIEVNPLMYRKKTVSFFQKEGVVMQAYRPLGAGKILQNPDVVAIAEKHGATPAQVLLRWLVAVGIVPLPKSEKPERIAANLDIFKFTLAEDEVEKLSGLTTKDAIAANAVTYRKCIIRDTPIPADDPQVTRDITED